MNKEFVPYDIALAIYQLDKEVDFGEDFGYWHQYNNKWSIETPQSYDYGTHKNTIPAPLYQQAFRWFREKHRQDPSVFRVANSYKYAFGIIEPVDLYSTYEEAQDACLRQLIEIVKKKQDEQKH